MNNLVHEASVNAVQGLEVYLPVEDNRVDARQLHEFLGSKKEFANWHKQNVERGQFVENQDFRVFDKKIKNPQGGRPTKDFSYTIPMAKEVCMLSNNDKGKMARKYFLAVEQTLLSRQASYQIEDPVERALAWAQEMREKQEQAKQIEQLTEEVAELEEDAEIGSIWAAQRESISVREFAHRLSAEGVNAGLRTVHQALRSLGWTFKGGRGKKTIYPTQKAITAGYLEKKISTSKTYGDGTSYETFQILITHKGQEKFIKEFIVFED